MGQITPHPPPGFIDVTTHGGGHAYVRATPPGLFDAHSEPLPVRILKPSTQSFQEHHVIRSAFWRRVWLFILEHW